MPIVIILALYSINISKSKGAESSTKDYSYIVEVFDKNGDKTGDFKGDSPETDPFLIAKSFGANPYVEDKFTVVPDLSEGFGNKIILNRAPDYTVIDGKKEILLRSWQQTVGGLLTEGGIELGDDDKINFSKDTELFFDINIKIIRVAITQLKHNEEIGFKSIKKDDPTMDKGKTKVETAGEKGVKVLVYRIQREDGVEVSRTLIETEITKEPVDEVVLVGTKPVITVRCKFNDLVIEATQKYGMEPNDLCNLMMKESNGNINSVGGNNQYFGLFQYTPSFWAEASKKAGFSGASHFDARAQIFTTAWALTHGYGSRW